MDASQSSNLLEASVRTWENGLCRDVAEVVGRTGYLSRVRNEKVGVTIGALTSCSSRLESATNPSSTPPTFPLEHHSIYVGISNLEMSLQTDTSTANNNTGTFGLWHPARTKRRLITPLMPARAVITLGA